jgi:hypothetical protein
MEATLVSGKSAFQVMWNTEISRFLSSIEFRKITSLSSSPFLQHLQFYFWYSLLSLELNFITTRYKHKAFIIQQVVRVGKLTNCSFILSPFKISIKRNDEFHRTH